LVRKTFPSLRKSSYQLIIDKIKLFGMQEFFSINKSDLSITYEPTDSQIISASMDDPEKIKSIERVTSTWIEEPTEITEDEFIQIDLRLRGDVGTYKQHILTFNPIDQNHWIKRHFFDQPIDDCTIDHSTAEQNRWIDKRYLKILQDLANQDSTLYNVYALGKWGVLQGLIYHNWDVCKEWPDSFDEVIYGLDFGFNNPTALLEIGYRDQELYERELLYQTGLTNADLLERLPHLIKDRNSYIYADCAEPARIEEMRRAGWNVKESNKSVKDGIDTCKRQRIHIHQDSVNDIKEIQSYKYKEDKNGNVIDDPVKWMDHLQDCRRYAVYTHMQLGPPPAMVGVDPETAFKRRRW